MLIQVFQFSDSENTLIEKTFFITRTETMKEDNAFTNKKQVTQKSMEMEENRNER